MLPTRVLAVAVLGLLASVLISCASVPVNPPDDGIRASKDPQSIERGRYLVFGPAHCVSCHGDPAREGTVHLPADVPLTGGRRFELGPLGTIVAPNITSDVATGIGALSDETLVRSLRYGVSHSGRPLAPFMPFAQLTDRDLQSIISFLRTVPPVANAVPPHNLSWLGSFAINVILKPQGPTARPPSDITPERSADYGRYLAHTVANCNGCHTLRSKLTGAFVGPPLAGGMKIEESGHTFITPNLTLGADGMLKNLNEHEFVQRFRARAQLPTQSPMPWAAFGRMTDDDLAAIYRYLRTLPPSPTPQG